MSDDSTYLETTGHEATPHATTSHEAGTCGTGGHARTGAPSARATSGRPAASPARRTSRTQRAPRPTSSGWLRERSVRPEPPRLVGESVHMRRCLIAISRAATEPNLPVLITGESGVGKELAARAIHEQSARRRAALVPVNCAALPLELAESELFGHVRGAFTGAVNSQQGAFAMANGGTIFLDEIGELPLGLQPKLLRVLETGRVRPVGGNAERPVDVRIITATNRNLHQEVAERRFRADLLFRIDVLHVELPALRDRIEDMPLLVRHLLRRHGYRNELSEDAMHLLRSYDWPGNVRELRNVLLRAAHGRTGWLQETDIRAALRTGYSTALTPRSLREVTWDAATRALAVNGGNRRATYEALGVPKSTFYRWLRRGLVREPLSMKRRMEPAQAEDAVMD